MARTFQTRSGPMLVLDNDAYVGRSLALYGEYGPGEWKLLRQLIEPGMTVVEIGANVGAHSIDMAKACAPGDFYAFEPQPRLFQLLCANLALNNIENAMAYPDACGAADGWAAIPRLDYGQAANFGGLSLGHGEGLPVRVLALDSLQLATCNLLKIDVEGFEPQVLQGARETILRCRPLIYIENDRPAQQQAVIDLIAGLDYRLHWHAPFLFDPENFNGVQENIFGGVASANMLWVPRESGDAVTGSEEIDPANWTCPVQL